MSDDDDDDDDVDDETLVPLALLDGGPAWLTISTPITADTSSLATQATNEIGDERQEQERLETALREAEERLAELSARSVHSDDLARRDAELKIQLSARDLESDTLRREVRDGHQELDRLRRQVEHERTARRHVVQKSNKSKRGEQREVMGFADPESQLRWDIQRTWVESTRPEEKDELRLGDKYVVGSDFCESVDGTEGVSRDRVLQVLVRLLTGRGVPDDHPLRSSKAGGAPAVIRVVDGAEWVCRRAPLQQSSPSARRLSYWRSPMGQIELSRVTVHDDLTP